MHKAMLAFLIIFVVIPIIVIANYYISRNKDTFTNTGINRKTSIINSAVLFALAYNIIFFLQEIFLVLGKNSIGLKSTLYHNNHSWEGSHHYEDLMQGSGAVAILIIGILFLLLRTIYKIHSWQSLFCTWLAFNGIMQSLPQFATAQFAPDTDTGAALYFLNFNSQVQWSITVISTVLMIGALIYFTRLFAIYSPSGYQPNLSNVSDIVLKGMLLGSILIIPFRIPPTDRIMAVVFLAIICLPTMVASSMLHKVPPTPVYNKINNNILVAPIIFLLVLLVIFQMILRTGVEFMPW